MSEKDIDEILRDFDLSNAGTLAAALKLCYRAALERMVPIVWDECAKRDDFDQCMVAWGEWSDLPSVAAEEKRRKFVADCLTTFDAQEKKRNILRLRSFAAKTQRLS